MGRWVKQRPHEQRTTAALSAGRMMTSGTDTSPKAADPIQEAVYNRVLMATMAGRRTMVVTDYTGGNGAVIGRRMADYMSSSGGMALTATGTGTPRLRISCRRRAGLA